MRYMILVLPFLLSACAQLGLNSKQEFKVEKVWVRNTLNKEFLENRKIQRSTAVQIENLIIQANAVDGVVALDKNTGRKVWTLPLENGVEPSIAQIRDRLFLASSDGRVYSIEGRTGKVVWQFETKAENIGTPYLDDGILYFISAASVLYAVDASNGKQLWVYSHQDTGALSIRGTSQPVVYKGLLYSGFADGSLVALDAKSGAIKWQVQLNKNKRFRDIDAQVVVDQDQLFVPGFDDKLYVLAPQTGALLWKLDQGAYSKITLTDKMIVYPTSSGEVLALNKEDGKILWSYKLKQGLATEVKLYKDMLVFGESQGAVKFLEASSGFVKGSFSPGRGVLASPLVNEKEGRVYFISGEANLWALSAQWTKKLDWPISH